MVSRLDECTMDYYCNHTINQKAGYMDYHYCKQNVYMLPMELCIKYMMNKKCFVFIFFYCLFKWYEFSYHMLYFVTNQMKCKLFRFWYYNLSYIVIISEWQPLVFTVDTILINIKHQIKDLWKISCNNYEQYIQFLS